MKTMKLNFVELMPKEIEDGVLYISMEYATAIHRCACGCGSKVVTPLSPKDWKLNFNGESISLSPSIGNWNFDCKSHYWIVNNNIKWDVSWSDEITATKPIFNKLKDKSTHKRKQRISLSSLLRKLVTFHF
ncbi:hypothetical protein SAMN05216464_11831 [Mucilaginibacter pineti]|uniref:Uncharacterized protein n=2 Tax=Mucilaginibacter pineti TaxID=1391627 RepID=A0A1G7L453_9SPHI|nr:hypothetical protein SAMN05216464_11831 [Mucilaginibacter pineti]